jgi:hypothetical protein
MTESQPRAVRESTAAGASPASLRALWASASILHSGPGYIGRVVAEVWVDGKCWITASSPSLLGAAMTALEDRASVHNPAVAFPRILTARHSGSQFLGHVVIEFINRSAPMVATIGTDRQLLVEYAHRTLRQLVAAA